MAEEEGFTGENNQMTNGGDNMPQIGLLTQYVKDISFENPNAPESYQWQTQPQIDVGFNIGADKIGEEAHEVQLQIDVTAKVDNRVMFQIELLYAGLFGMRNVPEEQLQPFLLAEAPRLLFPFARRVVSDLTRDGGFPPLLLDPIDFAGLYMQKAAEAQAAQSGGQAGEVTGQA
jgi:preprotein translocase subunit SecB